MELRTIVAFTINPSIDTNIRGELVIPEPSFAGAKMRNGCIGRCNPRNRINRREKSHDS
jgi:hypothetical protein